MTKSCSIQPKEVTDTYGKAGQIYADKVIGIRFDDVIETIASNDPEKVISNYKEDFISEMREASYDPRGYSDQEQFYDKIYDGLAKKFPEVDPDNMFNDLFDPALKSRFEDYFDNNKKAIAKAIVESRQKAWDKQENEERETAIAGLKQLLPELKGITLDTPLNEVAQRAGIGVGKTLLQSSGDFLLKQAQASSPDPETQKRYFVDTLAEWGSADNGYIKDEQAWTIFDDYAANLEGLVDGSIDNYINDFNSGSKQAFSDFFNKRTGTTSGVPKQGRTPFLMAKKAMEYAPLPQSVKPQPRKEAPLTERSKQILEEYRKRKNLDLIFDQAENDEQESALLMATLK